VLLKDFVGQDAPPGLWIHFRGLKDVANSVITSPHSFQLLQDHGSHHWNSTGEDGGKGNTRTEEQFSVSKIRLLFCICTGCTFYKEFQFCSIYLYAERFTVNFISV